MDYVSFNQNEFNRWIQDRGDMTLRLTYPLNESSVVIDAGGYKGDWAENIFIGYECFVYVLEPLKSFHDSIAYKFQGNNKIVPLNIALSNKNEEAKISTAGDSSSMFAGGDKVETIKCIDVKDFFITNKIDEVDLMKINIEGSEYDLLERIIELDLHKKIKNFQIQFHRFIENCDVRRKAIQEALSETHNCTWNYDWIWENWQIK
jgi:FkbM family methyltransferase